MRPGPWTLRQYVMVVFGAIGLGLLPWTLWLSSSLKPHHATEHWDVAWQHGKTAARNMAGRDVPHEALPYFWSDLADWTGLEYVGAGRAAGDPVVRGSLDDGSFSAWGLAEDGRVVSCVAVGGGSGDLDEARRLIRERAKADPAALADESRDLAGL